MKKMEVSAETILKVQTVFCDAIDILNRGDYHSALLKFDQAKETCQKLKPQFSGSNLTLLANLEERCQVHSVQIQQYIESSDDINLSDSNLGSSSIGSSIYNVTRESEIGDSSMLFSSITLDGKNVDSNESNIDTYWSGYLWDKVEALLGLLQPHTQTLGQTLYQTFQSPKQNSPQHREDITLESSFILLPEETKSRSVYLSDPIKKTLDPDERIKELEARNMLLLNQLEQMKKAALVQPQGVTHFMLENTKLKKSIIDFSNHVQKHNNLMKSQLSRGDSMVRGGSAKEMELQIRELFLKIDVLEKEILKKDKENKELSEYKEKWLNLKKEASARKKQKDSITESSTTDFGRNF